MSVFFFFNDTATTEIYTLSLHDALPILEPRKRRSTPWSAWGTRRPKRTGRCARRSRQTARSEEHTSELQSRLHLVCRLLLEKKKNVIMQTVNGSVNMLSVARSCANTTSS